MSKRVKATCLECATHEGLFITLSNGERLPSYHYVIGKGIVCNKCSENKNNHNHNFLATDIPGVCLCKCGVERYYSRSLQNYIIVEGERV